MTRIEVLEGVARLPRDAWNALVGDESPFLEWDWLASLEDAGAVGGDTGWLPRPLVVRDGSSRLIAACPLYVKQHSEGEFVFDWGWADAAHRAGIPYYPKLLVAVPFTPVSGARFLVGAGEDRPTWIARLGAALRELCEAGELSGVHVNFCREDELAALSGDPGPDPGGRDEGDGPGAYLPRVGLQYHWRNQGYERFEDYLECFRSKRRNQIRRERRALEEQGLRLETWLGDEIPDELFEPMFHCYRSTVDAHTWGRRYLNPRFFELLRDRFRSRMCFVVARRGDEVVAGTTNVVKGDALYGRYWGALRPARHLHFNVCYYAAIELCIERGLQRFEPGAGGDYKYLRGFDPEPTFSLHHLKEPRLAGAVARFLEAERGEARTVIEQLREGSPLRRRARDGASPAPRRGS